MCEPSSFILDMVVFYMEEPRKDHRGLQQESRITLAPIWTSVTKGQVNPWSLGVAGEGPEGEYGAILLSLSRY